jgi:hypothetical protein
VLLTTYDPGRLEIVDVSEATHPLSKGSITFPTGVWGVAAQGSSAFLVTGSYNPISGEMVVVDWADPAAPAIVGELPLSGTPIAIAVDGALACTPHLTAGVSGAFSVVDIAHPNEPHLLGTLTLPDTPSGIAFSGTKAYVTTRSSELLVIDVANPAAPVIVGGTGLPGELSDVELYGNFLYVSAEHGGLHILDLTNPSQPSLVATADVPHAMDLALVGTKALVTNASLGLSIVDITDPQDPDVLGTLGINGYANGIALTPTHAFLAAGVLDAIDLANLSFPPFIGQAPSGRANALACVGNIACLASYGWLNTVDYSVANAPVQLASLLMPGVTYGLDMSGQHAYVADGEPGLEIVDLSNPAAPTLIGSVDTPGEAREVQMVGSYAYVADWDGLEVVDVTPPQIPRIVGSIATPGYCLDVAINEPYAFLACYDAGIQIADISNPTAPHIVGSIATGYAGVVACRGDYLYSRGDAGFIVIDIHDPLAPEVLGAVEIPGGVVSITISDTEVYAATNTDVWVFDTSVPNDPRLLGSLGDYEASDAKIAGGHVLVSDASGLSVYPLQCAAPLSVDPAPTSAAAAMHVFPNPAPPGASIHIAHLARARAGLRIYDVAGRLVRQLTTALKDGPVTTIWDGRDLRGSQVPAGVYFLSPDGRRDTNPVRITLVP